MAEHSDVLIIGAGIFGASTAYHLSLREPRPGRITLIDRAAFPSVYAASTDINKIIRADYTSAFYMDLAYEAMEAWKTWPELKQYFHHTGWIHLNEKGGDMADRIRRNFKARGSDPTKDVSLDELRTMFGGIFEHTDLSAMDSAYWNPDAGWCDAEMATAEMIKAAVSREVKYEQGQVESLTMNQTGIEGVRLQDGRTFTGTKVLLCTGAWTSALLSTVEDELRIPEKERIETQVTAVGVCVAHYAMQQTDLDKLKDMPVTIFAEFGDAQPPPPSCNLLKFTNSATFTNTVVTSSGYKITVPPAQDQQLVSEKLKAETRKEMCKKVMPQFTDRPEAYWRLCWDAVTPKQDHLITKHPNPRLTNLYLAVGGSLHSYKFLPTIGRYIANVLGDISNGEEKDKYWAWKSANLGGRGAHEKVVPARQLSSLEDGA